MIQFSTWKSPPLFAIPRSAVSFNVYSYIAVNTVYPLYFTLSLLISDFAFAIHCCFRSYVYSSSHDCWYKFYLLLVFMYALLPSDHAWEGWLCTQPGTLRPLMYCVNPGSGCGPLYSFPLYSGDVMGDSRWASSFHLKTATKCAWACCVMTSWRQLREHLYLQEIHS